MKKEQKLLGYYNYTVILTYIGMLAGFAGIIYAFDGQATAAVICLMVSGFCDMFDGTVASTRVRTEQEKCFGIQIDSLSDLICFGVLPGVLVYSLNRSSYIAFGTACLYTLCALIRLAYFNVDEQERQKNSTSSREVYYGLPVTLAAVIVPLTYGLICLTGRTGYMTMTAAIAVMAVLFLLPFPLRKPRLIGKLCMVLCGFAEIFLVISACGDVW